MKKVTFAVLCVLLLVTFGAETSRALSQPRAAAAQTSWEGIVLEERLVAEVKGTAPDFARVLDFLRQHTELLAGGYAKVYLLPEAPGKPDGHAPSMEDELRAMVARFDEKERNEPSVEPVAYEVTIDRAHNSAFATLKINLLSGNANAASSALFVNLLKAEKGGWRVSGWSASAR